MPSQEPEPVTYAVSRAVIPNLDLGQTEVTQLSRVADNKRELERRVEGARPQGRVFLALKRQQEKEVVIVSTILPYPKVSGQ